MQSQQEHEAKAAELGRRAAELQAQQTAAAAEGAKVHREQLKLQRLKSSATPPAYWDARELNDAIPTHRIDVTAEMNDAIELLMNKTAKPQFHGQGRDSHGVQFSTFLPVKVWRIENHQLWRAYTFRREAIAAAARARGGARPVTPAIETTLHSVPSGAQLDTSSNEHLLFHGTKAEAVDTLCNRGFDARVGSLGGLFGAGCYFAENSSKSDEYVPPGGKQFMFLSRVVLGTPFVTPKTHTNLRRPPCVQGHFDRGPPCGHERLDSVMATTKAMDPNSWLEKFREFVVYDHSQCYPEYLIEYQRQ